MQNHHTLGDPPPKNQFVANWIRPNLIGILVIVAGFAAQWVRVDAGLQRQAKMEIRLESHIASRDIHIDPQRDSDERREIKRRLEVIEFKIDNLRGGTD